jgi:uncharacterized membrane protein YoaK (UPF0700 family)
LHRIRRVIAYDKPSQLFAVCLSAVAGYVDALGYLHLGGFFASFMSGNSTKLAIGLVLDPVQARIAASLLATFVGGVMAGAAVARLAGRHGALAALLFVAALLGLAAALHAAGQDTPAVGTMVLAMGAENAIFQRNGDVAIGLTYMTGALVKFGQRLTGALFGGDRWAWLPYALLWCGLVAGAITGAAAYTRVQLDGLWAAAGAAVVLGGAGSLRPTLLGTPAASRTTNVRAS